MSVINHIGVSGGKDSTALLLWAVYESGYDPASLRVSFCDTGNEAEETLDYVRMLGEKVHPIEWITPDLGFFDLVRKKGRFPSNAVRFCTQELKLKPTKRYVQNLVNQGYEVLLHSGVRAAESAGRAKLPERGIDDYIGEPIYRPLLRWSIADVWAIHAKYGIPPNPLYGWGLRRVGCAPCFQCRKDEVRILAERKPERIDRIREEEAATGDRSTFFAIDKAPKIWRSKPVQTNDGRTVFVATIDDIVLWSRTTRSKGHLQDGFEFAYEGGTCSHTSGACE